MASRSPKEAAAAKAMRQNYSAVSSAISHPDVAHTLASKLYDKGLVTKEVRNTVQLTRTLPPSQQATTLLADVESRISPQNLRRFVRVLKTEDALKPVAERLHQDSCTILSECGESESEDSETEQWDDYDNHGYGTVYDRSVSKFMERDDKSEGRSWWSITLAVALVAIAISVLLYVVIPFAVEMLQPTYYSNKAYLQQLYLREVEDVPDDQWPPVKKLTYVRLAMVDVERVGDTVEDEFLRKTLRGSADDILYYKVEVQFNELLQFEKGSIGARILIEGRPGSGKTTLMRKIIRDWINGSTLNDCRIIIPVALRQLPQKDELTLEDLVDTVFPKRIVRDLVNDIEEMDGLGVCFALDGMDEHSAAASETGYIYRLFQKIELHKSCVIISSRPSATIPFRSLASRYVEVIGFTSEAIDQYISEYYHSQPEKSQQLQKYLDDHQNVKNMCYLPVNLAIIVWLFDRLEPGDSLPDRETGIYESFTIMSLVRHMLTKDDTKYFHIATLREIEMLPDEEFSHEKKKSFYSICELAFYGRLNNQLVFTESELPFTLTFSFSLLTKDQLLPQQSYGKVSSYSFLHLTLQEFLAAFYLTRLSLEEQVSLIEEYAEEYHCAELGVMLKFYAGLTKLNSMEVFEHIMSLCQEKISMVCMFEAKTVPASRLFVSMHKGSFSFSAFTHYESFDADANHFCMAFGYIIAHNKEAITELELQIKHDDELPIILGTTQLSNLESLSLSHSGSIFGDGGVVGNLTAGCCTNIKDLKLHLSPYDDVEGRWMVALATGLTKVEKLEMIFGNNGAAALGEVFAAGYWSNLKTIRSLFTYSPSDAGARGAVALFTGLRNHSKLEQLEVKYSMLGDEVAVTLGELLANGSWPNLRILDLFRNHVIGDNGAVALAAGLRSHRQLETLILGYNMLGDEGAVAFGRDLAAGCWPNLKILNLSYNGIGDRGVTALATGLRNHSKLEELDIGCNHFGDDGVVALIEVLAVGGLPNLRVLRLYGIDIGYRGSVALATGLRNHLNLETLSMNWNVFEDEGAGILGEILSAGCWPSLRILDMSYNRFGDQTAAALGEVLAAGCWPNLKTLKLNHNDIGEEGANALFTGLRNHSKLDELDMGCNWFGDDGIVALVEVLAAGGLPNLRILRFYGIDIGERGATALATGLRDHFNLERVEFGSRKSYQAIEALDDLQQLTTVEYVFSYCSPSDPEIRTFTRNADEVQPACKYPPWSWWST